MHQGQGHRNEHEYVCREYVQLSLNVIAEIVSDILLVNYEFRTLKKGNQKSERWILYTFQEYGRVVLFSAVFFILFPPSVFFYPSSMFLYFDFTCFYFFILCFCF